MPKQPSNREFYIGWMKKAPKGFASYVKKVILVLLPLGVLAGILLGAKQKKFSTANFEFGVLTEVTGTYLHKPVPLLKILNGKDRAGNDVYTTVPLVGYGKFGAEGIMAELQKGEHFDGRELTLKGTLLYSDGKVLMQVSKYDNPLVKVSVAPGMIDAGKDLGIQSLEGEIIDPKCYFGVMKPGEGKVHRDCAIRCIQGGIPPVLRVTGTDSSNNYYIIVGKDGAGMNAAVRDFVADPVRIEGRAVQYDDWIVLYVDGLDKIVRL